MKVALLTGFVLAAVAVGLFMAFRSAPRVAARKGVSEADRFWAAAAETPLEVVGGGSLLATVSASWPLAILQYGEAGIGLRIRWLTRESGPFKWSEVIGIERSPRSLVVRALRSRSFRFIAMRGRDLDPVVQEAEERGITVQRVDSTIRWFIEPD